MSEWKDSLLNNFAVFRNGKSSPKRRDGGKHPVYGSNGIIGYSDSYNSENGTIIIGRVGSYCGATYFEPRKCWVTDNAIIGGSNDNADSKFLYYFLSNFRLNRLQSGSGQPLINQTILNEIEVTFPEKQEQQSIAAILSSLDNKIALLRRQNATLERLAQTLFTRWFVEFEFPNEAGQPYKSSGGAMAASELGEIPAGWRVGTLGDEFKIMMGQSPPGESYNESKDGMIFFQGRTDFGFRFPSIRLYTNAPKRIAEKFDTLVSVRAPVGDVNMAFDKCCIGRGLSSVKSKYKSYCHYKIRSFKRIFHVFESEGTVFGSLNKANFNNLENLLPSSKVVASFDEIVKPLDSKIYNNERQIQTLTRLRDALLPKLMSGEIRTTGIDM